MRPSQLKRDGWTMETVDLDVFAEMFHALLVVFVTGPLGTIDRNFTGLRQWICGFFRQVLDAVYVGLAYLLALSSVVDIQACDGRDDGEEDQPIPRR